MADFRAYQPSFTAGELSPALGARVDLTKYQSGLRTALNVFVHPHGGVSNRAGLQFIHEIKDSSKQARLIRFQFNTEQTYILEFGDHYIRIFRDGGLVLSGAAPYEVATAYTAADVQDLVFVQEADVLYLCQVNHPVRKLGRLADNNWTLTTVQFKPLINPPAGTPTVSKPGDTAGKPGYVATTYRYCVSAVADSGEESLPSNAGATVNDLAIQGGINRVTWAAVSGAARYIATATTTAFSAMSVARRVSPSTTRTSHPISPTHPRAAATFQCGGQLSALRDLYRAAAGLCLHTERPAGRLAQPIRQLREFRRLFAGQGK